MSAELFWVALAGFGASLVDGALGMGFGPTSSTILLSAGLSPASASTTVNIAKVFTGIAAAISHWRFRNIDHRLVLRLAIPGAIGAVIGVSILSHVPADTIKPLLAVLLLGIGVRILWRFSRPVVAKSEEFEDLSHDPDKMPEFNSRGTEVVAAAGGITNGLVGAWGPVVTPFLMGRNLAPRFAVGSVNTAEVAVATVSAGSLIAALGKGGLDVGVIIAMLAGGILAAPVAAWVVKYIPPRPMGVAVGGLLLLTNTQQLSDWADLGPVRWAAYAGVAALVALAALRPRLSRAGAIEGSPIDNDTEPTP